MRMCGRGCARLGGNAGPAESDVWTDVEDAEVDAAEGVETRARPRACGDARMTRKMLLLVRARQH